MFVLVVISVFAVNSSPAKIPAAIVSTRPSDFIFTKADTDDGFSFANEALPVNNKVVDRKLKRTLIQHNYHSIQSNILQVKAEKLFPIIEPILKLYGIPDDFKYIPLVESGLCCGKSPKGALGIWQFMPGTARTYGLKVGHGRDERLNVTKSTIAACKYIKELYGQFDSWTLAAAAYNNGEIKLQHQINKQNEDNYFRMHLNHETGIYVYKLIAMKEIISKPANYGYKVAYASNLSNTLLAYN
jgi:hypothetical protein